MHEAWQSDSDSSGWTVDTRTW